MSAPNTNRAARRRTAQREMRTLIERFARSRPVYTSHDRDQHPMNDHEVCALCGVASDDDPQPPRPPDRLPVASGRRVPPSAPDLVTRAPTHPPAISDDRSWDDLSHDERCAVLDWIVDTCLLYGAALSTASSQASSLTASHHQWSSDADEPDAYALRSWPAPADRTSSTT